jgi:hypothetical protein
MKKVLENKWYGLLFILTTTISSLFTFYLNKSALLNLTYVENSNDLYTGSLSWSIFVCLFLIIPTLYVKDFVDKQFPRAKIMVFLSVLALALLFGRVTYFLFYISQTV